MPAPPVHRALAIAAAFVSALLIAPAPPVAARSGLLLEPAPDPEAMDATTYDESGRAVGRSSFEMSTDETGVLTMTVVLAVDGGGRNVSRARLAPVEPVDEDGAPRLRLLEQRSRATRADGEALDLLVVDHERRRVSCYPPTPSLSAPGDVAPAEGARLPFDVDADLRLLGHERGRQLELPEDDHVVNVPIQLLFRPILEGRQDQLRFQLAACKGEPVLHAMIAVRAPAADDGNALVEVRYGPDLGEAVAWLAARLLPKLSFWFDARDGRYVGHRMPLHRKGPDILLLRSDVAPGRLGLR